MNLFLKPNKFHAVAGADDGGGGSGGGGGAGAAAAAAAAAAHARGVNCQRDFKSIDCSSTGRSNSF